MRTLRDLEMARLDDEQAQLNALIQAATKPLTKLRLLVERRKVSESRRKLFGLDAKNEVEITGNIGMAVTTSVIRVPQKDPV